MPAAMVIPVLAFAAAALIGCGDEGAEPGSAPASLVPADAVAYIEAVVKPEPDAAAAIEEIAARFPGGDDLGQTLIDEVDADLAEAGMSYAEDVEPWLGERGAIAFRELAEFEEDDPPPLIFETTDAEAAGEFVTAYTEGVDEDTVEEEHAGVEYVVSESREALAVVDGFLVLAFEEADIQDLIDVAAGDTPALDDVDAFSYELGGESAEEALVFVDLDLAAIADQGFAADPLGDFSPEELDQVIADTGLDLQRPWRLALEAEAATARIDFAVPVSEGTFDPGSGEVVADLPAEGEFAAGRCAACVRAFASLFEIGFVRGAEEEGGTSADALEIFEVIFGAAPDELLAAIGEVGWFVGSAAPLEIAAVAELRDPEVAETALRGTGTLLSRSPPEGVEVGRLPAAPGGVSGFSVRGPGLPGPVHAAITEDRLVVAIGDAALRQALEPDQTLGESGELESAEAELGDDLAVTAIADLATIVSVIASFERNDPDFREARPYLQALATLVVGTRSDGEDLIGSAVVGFE